MTLASMVFDGIVATLLCAMIFYAIKLNHRIAGLRNQETALQGTIDQFNQASAQAAAAASQLKQAGDEAESSLRVAVDKARALRDDLAFMIDRGSQLADGVEKTLGAARSITAKEPAKPRPAPPAPKPPAAAAAPEEPRSEAERELLKAIREKRMAR